MSAPWEGKMKSTAKKLAASGVLMVSSAVSALAGSVNQPGSSVGLPAGAPLPPGFYFIDTASWGERSTSPNTAVGVNIPVLAWSTPWTLLGARVQFLVAAPQVEVGVDHTTYSAGMYNPLFAGQLAWDLGGGFGFTYTLGGFAGVNTSVSFDTSSLNQQFALSYTANGWNLTANTIWGIQAQAVTATLNPDFVNVDLTATKKFGKWELGAVGFGSSDVSSPIPTYQRQSQFALGGLVGYDFGTLVLQTFLTRDVVEHNYGGYDTRLWGRVVIPLGNPLGAAPAPTGPMYLK
jgi:Putative MetA-pathway of phenol degradation